MVSMAAFLILCIVFFFLLILEMASLLLVKTLGLPISLYCLSSLETK